MCEAAGMWGRRKRKDDQQPQLDHGVSASYWTTHDEAAHGEAEPVVQPAEPGREPTVAGRQPTEPAPPKGVRRTTRVTTTSITVNGRQVDPNSPEGQQVLQKLGQLPQSTTPADPDMERYADLELAAQLHAQGVLTDEEFAAEKQRILHRP